jgi:[acyl-carrier-protein] S-malonyltransferase
VQQKLAFLFPGQGSQRRGMLEAASEHYPIVRESFAEASDALAYDLWALVADDDGERLSLTEFTQPALLTSSVALWRCWEAQGGPRPALLSGHSLGEFSALCCAGVFSLADAVRLVRERGRAMQAAVPVGAGAMAAVLGLDDEVVEGICSNITAAGRIVEAVNYNAPGQVVIAGHSGAVEEAIEALREAGARRAMALPVSAPFHTTLMAPAAERLDAALSELTLRAPTIPVVHNVHAATESDPEEIHALLVRQIAAPVRWTDCMATLRAEGVTAYAECGPGKVLGGLLKRIDRDLSCEYLEEPEALEHAAQDLAA